MKILITSILLLISALSYADQTKIMVCDGYAVIGFNEQPVRVDGQRKNAALIADNGSMFQVVQDEYVLTSPIIHEVKRGIFRAIDAQGVIFIKRGGTYQISADGTKWLYYDNCRVAGEKM
ncbi:hypothetical protein [Martelella alba]|uniref:C-type lysozyme inhibitor domain-containing protein n=1 Tax=Martelella alba TaxID=2590451 RepID=A0ABY2SH79_9HYPH|nr:hypothetical protein [Martelella alba]TKI03542.1 hypothetical protein FCN80_20910 [Martelella alba]